MMIEQNVKQIKKVYLALAIFMIGGFIDNLKKSSNEQLSTQSYHYFQEYSIDERTEKIEGETNAEFTAIWSSELQGSN